MFTLSPRKSNCLGCACLGRGKGLRLLPLCCCRRVRPTFSDVSRMWRWHFRLQTQPDIDSGRTEWRWQGPFTRSVVEVQCVAKTSSWTPTVSFACDGRTIMNYRLLLSLKMILQPQTVWRPCRMFWSRHVKYLVLCKHTCGPHRWHDSDSQNLLYSFFPFLPEKFKSFRKFATSMMAMFGSTYM